MQRAKNDPSIQLQDAFKLFNRASGQLAESYHLLEREVRRLNHEQQIQNETTHDLAARLQNLINALPAAVVVIDTGGQVTECNTMAHTLLGEPLLGMAWQKIIERNFDDTSSHQTYTRHRTGKMLMIETQPLGTAPGQVVLLSDHTETYRMEQHLERNQRLSAMGEMLARLSHQIRTPLATSMLYGSQLVSMLENRQAQVFATRLHTCLQHLDQMVSDMLLFSKGDAMKVEKLTAASLLQRLTMVCRSLEQRYTEEIQLRVLIRNTTTDECILGNVQALVAALENLITNAVQACSRPARVEVSAKISGDTLVLGVSDNGCGIPEDVQARMYEPFFTTKSNGTGLGLAVVRAVVQAHQGQIEVQSRPERGTRFRLLIPLMSTQKSERLTHMAGDVS